MLRLVQGDVGSGKTLVAAVAALDVIDAGYQVALMAPTALLAEQHARNFAQWFEPLGLSVLLLSGQQSAAQRREGLATLADGRAQIVIGTGGTATGETTRRSPVARRSRRSRSGHD